MWNKVLIIFLIGRIIVPAFSQLFEKGKSLIQKAKIKKGVKKLEGAKNEKDFDDSIDSLD